MAAKLQCEICGGKLIGKPGGIFECENCGSEYSTEWAKAKIQEITGTVKVEGTVEVTGMVQVDNHANKAALLERGNLALEDGEFENAEKLFNKVLNMDAKCGEAYLGLAMAEAWTSTREEYAAAYTAANSGLRGEKNAARARQFDPELAKWFAELDEQIRRAGERAIAESQEKEEAASHKRKQLLIDAVSDAMAELKDSKQTLEAKLKEAKQRATELDQLCQSFNTIQKQTEELKVSLASLHEQKNQLTTKREKLGLFTGREKKRIDAHWIGESETARQREPCCGKN